MNLVDNFMKDIESFWSWALSQSDPRVKNWLFMESIWPTFILTSFYLIGVFSGKYLMKSYKGWQLRWPLFIYNVILVWINWNIFYELLTASLALRYNHLCQPLQYSDDPNELRIARALWLFYISKSIELLDTFFFVFRKKNNQITFLHVYHHASIFPLWWIVVKWIAGGLSAFGPILNSFVHVVMYSYYGLSALGPSVQKYLWWKRYLTKLQLLQFFIGMSWACQLVIFNCPHINRYAVYFILAYGFTIVALFVNFYYQAYLSKRRSGENHLQHSPTVTPKKTKIQ